MALSDDQRAMLQLLLERDQSYEDLASVLGTDRADVRRKARAALSELAGADPDEDVALSDYLLGEADPITRADVARHLQSDPDALGLAKELSAKLQLIAPDAELPELRDGKAKRRPAPAPTREAADGEDSPPSSTSGRLEGLSTRQSRILVALGASAVLLIAVVLVATGVIGGGDETAADSGTDSGAAATTDSGGVASEEGTRVVLEPQNGSDAQGEMTFAFTADSVPYINFDITGLPDAGKDDSFVLWFLADGNQGVFLPSELPVSEDGTIQESLAIPEEVYALTLGAQMLDIGLVSKEEQAQMLDDLRTVTESASGLVPYQGESILRGEVPRTDTGTN